MLVVKNPILVINILAYISQLTRLRSQLATIVILVLVVKNDYDLPNIPPIKNHRFLSVRSTRFPRPPALARDFRRSQCYPNPHQRTRQKPCSIEFIEFVPPLFSNSSPMIQFIKFIQHLFFPTITFATDHNPMPHWGPMGPRRFRFEPCVSSAALM